MVITIRAQNPDGTMQDIPPELLAAMQQGHKPRNRAQTLFKTEINVDQTKDIRRNVEAQNEMYFNLIQDIHKKHQPPPPQPKQEPVAPPTPKPEKPKQTPAKKPTDSILPSIERERTLASRSNSTRPAETPKK